VAENVRKRIRIGDLLVETKKLTQEQLDSALIEQRKTGRKLGGTLIELGYISESELLNVLSTQLKIPLVDLKQFKFKPDLVKRMPETLARRYRSIVLTQESDGLLIGMADPTDIFAYDEITKHLQSNITLAVVKESELIKTFDLVYRRTDEISNLAQELGNELSESDIDLQQLVSAQNISDAPVVKLLQSLFEDAIQVNASDIHIEPDDKVLRIRQRVDGILYEQVMNEKRIANALVMRLKILAGLDISEKRLPQDGRFNIRIKDHSVDVRLSTMPVQYGESVVMRLLDQSTGLLELQHLGMPDDIVKRFRKVIHSPHGLVLVTGPTGSGKSTTLYSALKEINKAETKIITAEDPVEYRLPRMNQCQVNTKIGLDFPQILRAALRQDPDIILIGEMRDQVTVEIGLRAAMTGHLVLSTLHTNDARHTLERLLDMGTEGYLIASALRAVVAQRLLRRVCDSCKQAIQLNKQQQSWLTAISQKRFDARIFYKGNGCSHCNNTGYHGRVGIYEMIEPDEAMLNALRKSDISAFSTAVSSNKAYTPLLENALQIAAQGVTSIDEVMRLAGEVYENETHTVQHYNLRDLDNT
jgi:MSHA biogenesis protein MshE